MCILEMGFLGFGREAVGVVAPRPSLGGLGASSLDSSPYHCS